jgi:hypothetical protein
MADGVCVIGIFKTNVRKCSEDIKKFLVENGYRCEEVTDTSFWGEKHINTFHINANTNKLTKFLIPEIKQADNSSLTIQFYDCGHEALIVFWPNNSQHSDTEVIQFEMVARGILFASKLKSAFSIDGDFSLFEHLVQNASDAIDIYLQRVNVIAIESSCILGFEDYGNTYGYEFEGEIELFYSYRGMGSKEPYRYSIEYLSGKSENHIYDYYIDKKLKEHLNNMDGTHKDSLREIYIKVFESFMLTAVNISSL